MTWKTSSRSRSSWPERRASVTSRSTMTTPPGWPLRSFKGAERGDTTRSVPSTATSTADSGKAGAAFGSSSTSTRSFLATRLDTSRKRKTSRSGRPRAVSRSQAVIASATGLRYVTLPCASVVTTPSPRPRSVTSRRSLCSASDASVARRTETSRRSSSLARESATVRSATAWRTVASRPRETRSAWAVSIVSNSPAASTVHGSHGSRVA